MAVTLQDLLNHNNSLHDDTDLLVPSQQRRWQAYGRSQIRLLSPYVSSLSAPLLEGLRSSKSSDNCIISNIPMATVSTAEIADLAQVAEHYSESLLIDGFLHLRVEVPDLVNKPGRRLSRGTVVHQRLTKFRQSSAGKKLPCKIESTSAPLDAKMDMPLISLDKHHHGTDVETLMDNLVDPSRANGADYIIADVYQASKRASFGLPAKGLYAGKRLLSTRSHYPGIHSPYAYVSTGPGAMFALHVEDFYLLSANLLHAGAPKIWAVVHPSHSDKLEACLVTHLGLEAKCSQFVRHQNIMLPPSLFRQWQIRFALVCQKPGDLILLNNRAYHMGGNVGANIAEAINFCQDDWTCPPRYQDCQHCGNCQDLPLLLSEMVMKQYREFEGVDPDEPRQKPNKSKKQSNPVKYESRLKKEQGARIRLPDLSKPSKEEGELPSVELNAFKEQPIVLPAVDKADLTILTAQQNSFNVQRAKPLTMESPCICVQEQPCGLESVLQHDQHHTARALSGAASDDGAPHQAKVQGDTLEDMVQHCQTRFRDRGLKIFNDERSETINPEEINTFFARFHEGQWLSNVNIMPLIFSFDWPHTTAVLDSDYANIKPGTKARPWPIHPHHTRVILPCCSQFHWTLFDISSETRTIRCYNSLGDVVPEVLRDIMVRVKDAMTWIDELEQFIICSAVNNPVLQ